MEIIQDYTGYSTIQGIDALMGWYKTPLPPPPPTLKENLQNAVYE